MNLYFKIYLIMWMTMSCITLLLYMIDKIKAMRNSWRIKEAILLMFTFFLGSIGALIGINVFRHKTRHWYFQVVSIFSLVLHIAIAIKIFLIK